MTVAVFGKLLPNVPAPPGSFYFLALPEKADPPASVLSALRGGTPNVLAMSECRMIDGRVTHVALPGSGVVVRIDTITWGTNDDATIEASWYREPEVAQGYRFHLVRRTGVWRIEREETTWVS